MNTQEFQHLIQRYQDNCCSVEEKKILEDWLSSREKQEGQFETWNHQAQQDLGKKIFTSMASKIDAFDKPVARQFPFVTYLKVAASILLVVSCSFAITRFSNNSSTLTTVADSKQSSVPEVNKVILSDGTIVWLKGKSKIYYPTSFTGQEREVSLDGEALFEVTKDATHPFIIHCGSLTTKVVGTSFNIKNENDLHQIEVVVFTGKVSLSDQENKKQIVLLPNQKVTYQKNDHTFIKTNIQQAANYLAGTEFDMKFEDISVAEVIKRIEKKFNVTIKLRNADSHQCLISADFTDQSLAITLKLISESLGGDFKENEEWIDLQIPSCR